MLRLLSSSARRRRLVAVLALLAAVGVVIGVVVSTGSPTSSDAAHDAAAATGAATVQRRDLVATDTESGTLSYDDPQTVYDRLSGTITWLPHVGQVIRPGGALFKVDGQPVILMRGSTPAFRNLSAADVDGADVEQLNRNLVNLGFDAQGIVIDDEWQPATTVGVELMQESLGETETGSLSLGHVVFLPGDQLVSAVDATVGGTGSGGGTGGSAPGGSAGSGAGGSGGDGSGASSTSTPVISAAPQFVSLRRRGPESSGEPAATSATLTIPARSTPAPTAPPTTTTPAETPPTNTTGPTTTAPARTATPAKAGSHVPNPSASDSQTLSALTALLKAESAQLKAAAAQLKADESSGKGSKGSSGSGSGSPKGGSDASGGGGSATAILQTTSTQLVVTVDLSASSQSEAQVGERVTVELPAGNTVNGTISAVSPVAQSSNNSGNGGGGGGDSGGSAGGSGGGGSGGGGSGGSSSTVPVTIALRGHQTGAGLDQAAVSVNFVQAKARHVLSVPVTALLATSGGNYAVQEATAPYRLIPVTTGLFAAGYVQISGSRIYPGMQVTDSQG